MEGGHENPFPVVIGQKFTPQIARTIFNLLDEEDLLKCRSVCSVWKNVVDSSTKLWTNPELYRKAASEGRLNFCKKIIQRVENKNPPLKKDPIEGESVKGFLTPLHIAAGKGHVAICRLIMHHLDDKNPKNDFGVTPLHSAAGQGWFGNPEVYHLIMNKVDDKNPRDFAGNTPLHVAVGCGNYQVCQLIVHSANEKNPPNALGNTPLHFAARLVIFKHGPRVDICRLILENVEEKYPVNNAGETPLDWIRTLLPILEHNEKKRLERKFNMNAAQEIEQLWSPVRNTRSTRNRNPRYKD